MSLLRRSRRRSRRRSGTCRGRRWRGGGARPLMMASCGRRRALEAVLRRRSRAAPRRLTCIGSPGRSPAWPLRICSNALPPSARSSAPIRTPFARARTPPCPSGGVGQRRRSARVLELDERARGRDRGTQGRPSGRLHEAAVDVPLGAARSTRSCDDVRRQIGTGCIARIRRAARPLLVEAGDPDVHHDQVAAQALGEPDASAPSRASPITSCPARLDQRDDLDPDDGPSLGDEHQHARPSSARSAPFLDRRYVEQQRSRQVVVLARRWRSSGGPARAVDASGSLGPRIADDALISPASRARWTGATSPAVRSASCSSRRRSARPPAPSARRPSTCRVRRRRLAPRPWPSMAARALDEVGQADLAAGLRAPAGRAPRRSTARLVHRVLQGAGAGRRSPPQPAAATDGPQVV